MSPRVNRITTATMWLSLLVAAAAAIGAACSGDGRPASAPSSSSGDVVAQRAVIEFMARATSAAYGVCLGEAKELQTEADRIADPEARLPKLQEAKRVAAYCSIAQGAAFDELEGAAAELDQGRTTTAPCAALRTARVLEQLTARSSVPPIVSQAEQAAERLAPLVAPECEVTPKIGASNGTGDSAVDR